MRFFLITSAFVLVIANGYSQVVKSVVLDSVVVAAVKRGFDVEDFIDMVKADTSFLRAFRYLRNNEHEVIGMMTVFGKKGNVEATRFRKAQQITENKKRWIDIEEEKVSGKFYNRKEEPKTYTAELFDDIFFYKDTLPVLSPSVSISGTTGTNNSGNINKLKKLVFNPGSDIDGVPVVGKRMAIFEDDMTEYYDYKIGVENFKDSISCYVFSCSVKSENDDYPVVKYLNTWFDRKNFKIVYRDYRLKYSGILFEFDVAMKVKTTQLNEEVFPESISYSGFWDLPLKKEERIDFLLEFRMDTIE